MVYRGEISVDDSVELARREISVVFNKADDSIEKDIDTGFYGDVVGICPLCGNEVIKGKYSYGCRDYKNCNFRINMIICNRVISKKNAEMLLKDGTTSKIEGFTSKNGKLLNGKLKIDNDKKIVFDFN